MAWFLGWNKFCWNQKLRSQKYRQNSAYHPHSFFRNLSCKPGGSPPANRTDLQCPVYLCTQCSESNRDGRHSRWHDAPPLLRRSIGRTPHIAMRSFCKNIVELFSINFVSMIIEKKFVAINYINYGVSKIDICIWKLWEKRLVPQTFVKEQLFTWIVNLRIQTEDMAQSSLPNLRARIINYNVTCYKYILAACLKNDAHFERFGIFEFWQLFAFEWEMFD